MSHSANNKSKKNYLKYLDTNYLEDSPHKSISYKSESSKKIQSKIDFTNINYKFAPNLYSNSTTNTNFERKDDFPFLSYQIKPIIEGDSIKNYIPKKKLTNKPYSIINNKIISFQNQKNKEVLEFSLFDDSLIFKDINKSYLQDEQSDDGAESSDEKINDSKYFLSRELEDSIKELSKSLHKKQGQNLLSRSIRFKNE